MVIKTDAVDSPREEVIKLRAEGLTFNEIGRRMGRTREWARQQAGASVVVPRRPKTESDVLMTAGDVARLSGVPLLTVTTWVKLGILPGFRSGPRCHLRVRREDAVDFLKNGGPALSKLLVRVKGADYQSANRRFLLLCKKVFRENGVVDINDEQWQVIEPLIIQPSRPKGGPPRTDPRDVLRGIFWVLQSGAGWAELPRGYPSYRVAKLRFKEWFKNGSLENILKVLSAPQKNRS